MKANEPNVYHMIIGKIIWICRTEEATIILGITQTDFIIKHIPQNSLLI